MTGMIMAITIGITIITAILIDIAWQIRQIRQIGVERSQPVVTQPTPTAWLATDALQAAQEQAQTRAAAKIANAVRWR